MESHNFVVSLSSLSSWIDNTTTHSRATRPAFVVAMGLWLWLWRRQLVLDVFVSAHWLYDTNIRYIRRRVAPQLSEDAEVRERRLVTSGTLHSPRNNATQIRADP